MKLLRPIDYLLDRITMYRLLLYYLIVLLIIAAGLNVVAHVLYDPWAIAVSASYLCLVCWLVNEIFAYFYKAPTNNSESSLITALILALIITPISSLHDLIFLTAVGGLAMASKYVLAIGNKHIFNPAAIAVVITGLAAGQTASWWVGATPLVPAVVIGGFLIIRKVQRIEMALTFMAVALVSAAVIAGLGHTGIGQSLHITLLHSPLLFLATVMLTEPQTSPVAGSMRRWYAVLTGVLLPPQVHLGGLYSTPELVLVIGNIFAYIGNPKIKVMPRLLQKLQPAPDTLDLVFGVKRQFVYQPGQYMEWTLPHTHSDGRGVRRYFTLASSPTEKTLRVGVKMYQPRSSFKRALGTLKPDTLIAAGQLGGDFVLPKNSEQKLAFIAGGIGITPFRSMLKYLIDSHDQRTVTLVYAERASTELMYRDVLEAAQHELGAKIVYALEDTTAAPRGSVKGRVDGRLITAHIPDYAERLFYLSGPRTMVTAITDELHSLGVPGSHIETDFFPGYA